MKNSNFAHLHVHNEYSQLDGFGTAKNYIARTKELGFKFIACTNHGNIDGLLKFQKECDKQEINPVLGCEAYIVPDAKIKPKKEKRGHITILVKNQTGWQELCKLLTYANLTGFHHRPRIDYESLLNCDLSGFVIMTGCAGSFLNLEGGISFGHQLGSIMKKDFYFEIMPHDIEIQYKLHKRLIQLKGISKTLFIATNDCHYIYEDEWKAQEVLLAIQTKAKWTDKDRFRFGFTGLHLRTADEMAEAFEEQGQFNRSEYLLAMRNTIKVAKECCEFRIPKQDISLPPVTADWGEKEHFDRLKQLVEDKRMELIHSKAINELQVDEYNKRIAFEL